MFGRIAAAYCGVNLPIEVMQSYAGFFIGTAKDSEPYSRESVEYWASEEEAANALKSGLWTQRLHP